MCRCVVSGDERHEVGWSVGVMAATANEVGKAPDTRLTEKPSDERMTSTCVSSRQGHITDDTATARVKKAAIPETPK